MNDADRAPSPKRLCSRFGIRNAALNASAAIPVVAPRYFALNDSRTTPRMRDSRMPAATRAAPAARDRGAGCGAPLAGAVIASAGGDALRALGLEQSRRVLACRAPHVADELLATPREHRREVERALLSAAAREKR